MHDVCVSSRDDGLLDKMHGVCVYVCVCVCELKVMWGMDIQYYIIQSKNTQLIDLFLYVLH